MDKLRIQFNRTTAALLVLVAALGSAAVLAASPERVAGESTRRSGKQAACPYGVLNQGRPVCMTKADLIAGQSRQRALENDPEQYLRNALKRCERLPADQRSDCEARMHGSGTTSGSVAGGGIYRELVTREIGSVGAVPPAGSGAALPGR